MGKEQICKVLGGLKSQESNFSVGSGCHYGFSNKKVTCSMLSFEKMTLTVVKKM